VHATRPGPAADPACRGGPFLLDQAPAPGQQGAATPTAYPAATRSPARTSSKPSAPARGPPLAHSNRERSTSWAVETTDRHGQRPCKPCYQHVHLITGLGCACQHGRRSHDDPARQFPRTAFSERSCSPSGPDVTDRMLIFSGRRPLRSILAEYSASRVEAQVKASGRVLASHRASPSVSPPTNATPTSRP
jgi:hypothetical protein